MTWFSDSVCEYLVCFGGFLFLFLENLGGNMDLACGFPQPNLLSGKEGASYKTLDRFGSRILFRSGDFSCKFLGNSRIRLNACLGKRSKKVMCSSLGGREKSDDHLWRLNSRAVLVLKGRRANWLQCQGNDSLAYVNGNGANIEFLESEDGSSGVGPANDSELSVSREKEERGEQEDEIPTLDELRELLQKAMRELEVAQINSTMFEEKAQKISEAAIALKDEATNAWNDVNATLDTVQQIVNEESVAKEAVQKATMALSLAEARLQVAVESLELTTAPDSAEENDGERDFKEDEKSLFDAQEDIREFRLNLENCEADLRLLQSKKEELQKEVDRLNEVAEKAQLDALKAEEDVANIMLLAEQAVAFELEATKRVNDAEIALQRAEKSLSIDTAETSQGQMLSDTAAVEKEERIIQGTSGDISVEWGRDVTAEGDFLVPKALPDSIPEQTKQSAEDFNQIDDLSDHENAKLSLDSLKESEVEAEKSRSAVQTKKLEAQKDLIRENTPLNAPKALLKKSSRFFSASFFSFTADGTELTPGSVFQGAIESLRKQWPKLVVGLLLFGAGYVLLATFSCGYS